MLAEDIARLMAMIPLEEKQNMLPKGQSHPAGELNIEEGAYRSVYERHVFILLFLYSPNVLNGIPEFKTHAKR